MTLPKDLIGGWEFKNSFETKPLSADQIWRKVGPVDAIKIVRVMMPGHPEHDGAAHKRAWILPCFLLKIEGNLS